MAVKWVRIDETWYHFQSHVAAHGQARQGKAIGHHGEHGMGHPGDRVLGREIGDPGFGQVRQGLDLMRPKRAVGEQPGATGRARYGQSSGYTNDL